MGPRHDWRAMLFPRGGNQTMVCGRSPGAVSDQSESASAEVQKPWCQEHADGRKPVARMDVHSFDDLSVMASELLEMTAGRCVERQKCR